jgi:DNA-binding GntR family transcriptional regulator
MNRLSSPQSALVSQPDSSAVERVIAHIRNGIRDGRFAPGQRLIESDLQISLHVSRGPIREAIRRLAADNIVQVELHKGARVRKVSAAEIKAIYEVREVLEGLACRLAAQNLKPQDRRLQTLERQFDKTFDGTAQSYLRYNENLHHLILQMSANAELIRLVENLQIASFILLVHVLVEASSIRRARSEHRPIVDAILKKDAARAERAMRNHIRSTLRFVLREAAERLDLR